MFVYIVGSIEQNIFKLGVAGNPLKHLPSIQAGSPYALSILSEVCLKNRSAAVMAEKLGYQDLSKYQGSREWLVDVPSSLSTQFTNGHYLRALSDKAGVSIVSRSDRTAPIGSANLQ